jgi:Protein of unknown function (DUF3307).
MDELIFVFVYILFAHYVSDFVLQTRWQAENKSKSLEALFMHVITYSFSLFCWLALPVLLWAHDPQMLTFVYVYVGINAVAHFITDFATSRISSYFHRKGKIHAFWGVIGFDQFLHQAVLLLTFFPTISLVVNGYM